MIKGFKLSLFVLLPILAMGMGLKRDVLPPLDSTNDKVIAFIDSVHRKNGFPGMCVSYLLPDGNMYHLATGMSDLQRKTAMKPNTMLMSGSAPKMFYATIALQLREQGKIALEDKVSEYLGTQPWYSRIPNASTITVRQIINHTSGIMEYHEQGDFSKQLLAEPDKEWSPIEILSYVFDKEPLFEAGSSFSYADTNYFLLGLIIEAITGSSIHENVDRRILRPLGMNHTVPSLTRTIEGLSPGYSMANSPFGFSGSTIQDGKFIINPQFEWCGGGYVSTTADWIKFISGLMKGDLLDEESLALMKSGIQSNLGLNEEYGYGLQIRPSSMGRGYGHGGWFPGYLTEVEYFPEKNIAIAIQFNTDDFSKIKGHPRSYILKVAELITGDMSH